MNRVVQMTVVLTLVLVSLASQALAELSTGNMRLDHAIWPKHAPKLIVAGTIDPIRNPTKRINSRVEFIISIQNVILGDAKYVGQQLLLPSPSAASFDWPSELVPFEKGTRCIFVLTTGWGQKRDEYYINAVVPASGKRLPAARDGLEAKRLLEGEILAVLQGEKLPERQRALLIQLAPILTKAHAREVLPFVKSKNVWVMRAALSALIYATEEDRYIPTMATDVQHFFSSNKSSNSHRYFLDHYFFLQKRSWTWGSRWSKDEASKHLRILNAMFDTGIINDEVKKKLNPKPKKASDKKSGEVKPAATSSEASQKEKQDRVKWVGKCLNDFRAIKVGMTRGDVEKRFVGDGGLTTSTLGRYTHPECNYFKIDVTYSVKRNPQDMNRVFLSPNDKVIKVSKPYLEHPFVD